MGDAARAIDRITVTPRFTADDAARLNAQFEGVPVPEMLRALIAHGLIGRAAVVSSFGAESAVLLHLIAQVNPDLPVLFLNTGKIFPETIAYRDLLIERLGLTDVRTITPDVDAIEKQDSTGLRWSYDPDGCCELRKVIPLETALAEFDTSISGRKGFQSKTRAHLQRFEIEKGWLKVNPLAEWGKPELDAYFEAHDLPRHPLEAQGYLSIGCAPCTSVVKPGEDPRAGRWRGWEKVECGIHGEPITRPDDNPANDPVF